MDDSRTDQTLNQQPVSQTNSHTSRLGTGDGVIEERFRQLKAATLRAGLRMSRSQLRNSIEPGISSSEPMPNGNGSSGVHGGTDSGVIREKGKGCKRASSLLVAMALGTDTEVKKSPEEGASLYDCKICLDIARDPILTCCGHLFCWACFCMLPYVDSAAKECPECEGEVTDANIIPIYGNGDGTRESKLDSGLIIPPRPKAQRVESMRQQRVARGMSHVPVSEALRRIRTSINAIGDGTPVDSSNDRRTSGANLATSIREDVRLPRTSRFTRVLSESAASLSSISLALNNAERLVEDLETYINHRQLQRSVAQPLSADYRDSLAGNALVSALENQTSIRQDSSSTPAPSLGPTGIDNGSQQT